MTNHPLTLTPKDLTTVLGLIQSQYSLHSLKSTEGSAIHFREENAGEANRLAELYNHIASVYDYPNRLHHVIPEKPVCAVWRQGKRLPRGGA